MENTKSTSSQNPMLFPGFKITIIEESINTVKGRGITNLNFVLHHEDKNNFIYHGTIYLDATEYNDQGEESVNYDSAYSGFCLSGYVVDSECGPIPTFFREEHKLEFNGQIYYPHGENIEPLIPGAVSSEISWKTHGDVSAMQSYECNFRPKTFSDLQESLFSAQKNILHRDYWVTTKTGADYMSGVIMLAAGFMPSEGVLLSNLTEEEEAEYNKL